MRSAAPRSFWVAEGPVGEAPYPVRFEVAVFCVFSTSLPSYYLSLFHLSGRSKLKFSCNLKPGLYRVVSITREPRTIPLFLTLGASWVSGRVRVKAARPFLMPRMLRRGRF